MLYELMSVEVLSSNRDFILNAETVPIPIILFLLNSN